MGEFNAKDANFLWRQIGRIDGVIETLNRTEMIFEIRNDGRNEYGRYNNCGGKI